MILDHEALNYYYKSLYRLSAFCLTSVLMYHCQLHTGYITLWQYTLLKLAVKSEYHLSYLKVPKCLTNIFYGKETWVGSWISWPVSFCSYLHFFSAALKTDVKDEAQAAILRRLNDHSHIEQKYKRSLNFGKQMKYYFSPWLPIFRFFLK